MLKHFKRLFVSHSCYACDRELTSGEEAVCHACLSQIEPTGFHQDPLENELFYRFAGKVRLDGAACLFYFDKKGTLQSLIQAMKYEDAPQLATFLGKCLGETLKDADFIKDIDILVPVPLHRSKKIKRGYNQAEHIALGISEVLEIPVDANTLKRTRKTLTQTRKSGLERWENVSGAFSIKEKPGDGILLVDDVITTGSTLEACLHAIWSLEEKPTVVKVAGIGMARKS